MNIGMNPNGELVQSAVNAPNVIEIPDSFLDEAARFREMMMMYMCAIREVKTKLEVLNDDLAIKNQRNPMKLPRTMKPPREWTSSRVAKLRRRRLSPRNLVLRRSMIEIRRIEWQCVGIVGSYGMVQRAERSEGIDAFDSDSHGSRRSCREAAFAARFQRVFLSNGKGGEELRRSERWTTCRRSGETCGPRR